MYIYHSLMSNISHRDIDLCIIGADRPGDVISEKKHSRTGVIIRTYTWIRHGTWRGLVLLSIRIEAGNGHRWWRDAGGDWKSKMRNLSTRITLFGIFELSSPGDLRCQIIFASYTCIYRWLYNIHTNLSLWEWKVGRFEASNQTI